MENFTEKLKSSAVSYRHAAVYSLPSSNRIYTFILGRFSVTYLYEYFKAFSVNTMFFNLIYVILLENVFTFISI